MGKVEVWELRESSSENLYYEESESSYVERVTDETDEERAVDLFETDYTRLRGSDSENTEEESEFESEESVSEDSDNEQREQFNLLQYFRQYSQQSGKFYDFDRAPRHWNGVFYITSAHNLESVAQNFFYYIEIGRINPNAQSRYSKKIYTPLYTLGPGESMTLSSPSKII
ncbi:hypothetical protein TpMuguga_02g00170 [Theileria parva strain Muguga]|uniref:Uncharacterized protein n=1 Tax=Theileria parva TaxID=5875 RepID=Q4N5X2_THEPA|nr:uncharacterized protein TpMuguga_02g00170 [Theileria parva strain Muguga]EAN32451.1 hypothetical protein TpMuguga_02g00170 [Theileria parva strain Muguga]|eukprot:XP_764734.1 hypothetical protein [Theileria parva strain Muguga]